MASFETSSYTAGRNAEQEVWLSQTKDLADRWQRLGEFGANQIQMNRQQSLEKQKFGLSKEQFGLQQEALGLEKEKFGETVRSNKANEGLSREQIDTQRRGQDITKEQSVEDRKQRYAEMTQNYEVAVNDFRLRAGSQRTADSQLVMDAIDKGLQSGVPIEEWAPWLPSAGALSWSSVVQEHNAQGKLQPGDAGYVYHHPNISGSVGGGVSGMGNFLMHLGQRQSQMQGVVADVSGSLERLIANDPRVMSYDGIVELTKGKLAEYGPDVSPGTEIAVKNQVQAAVKDRTLSQATSLVNGKATLYASSLDTALKNWQASNFDTAKAGSVRASLSQLENSPEYKQMMDIYQYGGWMIDDQLKVKIEAYKRAIETAKSQLQRYDAHIVPKPTKPSGGTIGRAEGQTGTIVTGAVDVFQMQPMEFLQMSRRPDFFSNPGFSIPDPYVE